MKNEPVFPQIAKRGTAFEVEYYGLTLRDYFAGQALIMLGAVNRNTLPKDAAWQAYGIADKMLAEREKTR